jgi:hypothetical protein
MKIKKKGSEIKMAQQRMNQPPAFVSTKDLAYLTDAMSWELLAMKKCHQFSQQCKDNEIKQTIDKAGRMHSQHYERLLKHLNPGMNQGGY